MSCPQVAYLDRVMQLVAVARNRLQLVAMCCLVIAAKYEEAEENVPHLNALNDLATIQYSADVAHQTEVLVLEKLDWTLSVVTPVHYIGMYFKMVRTPRCCTLTAHFDVCRQSTCISRFVLSPFFVMLRVSCSTRIAWVTGR
jgi:hypothetical protein